jgi:hypothetical protein
MTAGKRDQQKRKREKAQAKVARRAARRLDDTNTIGSPVDGSEAEVIEALATLQKAVEVGEVSLEEFEERREDFRKQFEQIERLKE